jgi:glycosyltransferase involved in cell wall biosynthesis
MEGILVQDGDPWVMAGAILEIGRNAEFAKLLGRKARARALERHDKDRIISDLLNTYKEVLACNSENNKDDNQQYNKSIG